VREICPNGAAVREFTAKMNNMKKLTSQVAVVTGASRGIGAAIAKRLAADGARVVVNYCRTEQAALEVVSAIQALGSEAIAVKADIADHTQIQRLFLTTLEHFGRLDILVNNAGVFEMRPIEQIDAAHYAATFDVNVRGVLFACQEAARHFGSEGGRIINLSSVAARLAMPAGSVHVASKAAVEAITRCLAVELGARGITVNAVAPGATETDIAKWQPPELREQIINATALGRIGKPEDIADVIAFLASDQARWITGKTIGVDGGYQA